MIPSANRLGQLSPLGLEMGDSFGLCFKRFEGVPGVVAGCEGFDLGFQIGGEILVELVTGLSGAHGDGNMVALGGRFHPDREQRRAMGEHPPDGILGPKFPGECHRPLGHQRGVIPRPEQVARPRHPMPDRVDPRLRFPLGGPGTSRALDILNVGGQASR